MGRQCGVSYRNPEGPGIVSCVLPPHGEDQPHEHAPECEGHPAGPFDPMGETVYCDGSCRKIARRVVPGAMGARDHET